MKVIIDCRLSLLPAANQMTRVRALRGAAERGMTQQALAQRRRRTQAFVEHQMRTLTHVRQVWQKKEELVAG